MAEDFCHRSTLHPMTVSEKKNSDGLGLPHRKTQEPILMTSGGGA